MDNNAVLNGEVSKLNKGLLLSNQICISIDCTHYMSSVYISNISPFKATQNCLLKNVRKYSHGEFLWLIM